MRQSTLSVSIAFLLAGLIGGLVLVTDLWMKNAPSATVATAARGGTASSAIPMGSGQAASPPTLDGTIAEGEYANVLHDEVTGMSLYWSIVGGKLYLGLKSPGHGWTAVGFDPDGPMMKGADILMGFVKDGEVAVEDHYADGQVTHKHDDELGGTDDIEESAGSEDESGTALEFVRPLRTDDEYDKPIRPGEMFVMLAYADSDDWTSYHKKRNTVAVDFFAAPPASQATAATVVATHSGEPPGPPTVDGVITEGEYANALHDEETGMSLYWTIVGDKIYIGLHSPGHGWAALGLEPDGPMMQGADILIGYVKDGQAFARDHYADTPYTHKADEELGGTDDIEEFAGSEGESGTTLEWVRPLQMDDPYDKPFEPGEVSVLLAYAAEKDDWVTYHKGRSRVTINFFSGTGGSGP